MKKITFMTMAMVAAMSAGTAMTLASCSEAGSLKTSISTDNDRYVVTEGKIVKQYLKVGKFISVRIEADSEIRAGQQARGDCAGNKGVCRQNQDSG